MSEIAPLLITGTDTGVGKTYVAALILRQLREAGCSVGVYKPACSGVEFGDQGQLYWPDLEHLRAAAGLGTVDSPVAGNQTLEELCPQKFFAPLAPPVAAELEGDAVDPGLIDSGSAILKKRFEILVIEGVGGLLCPLTSEETIADFAARMAAQVVIVTRLNLGTINHTLLTLEVAKARGLNVRGLIFNEGSNPVDPLLKETNPEQIARFADVPVLEFLAPHATDLLLDWKEFLTES